MLISNQQPSNGQSFHFPLWHVVNTDYVGDPTLKIVFEVYVANVLVHTEKVYPPPDKSTNAYYDVAPIIRSYAKNNYFGFRTNAIKMVLTNDFFIDYTVKIGEEWIASGIPTGIYQQVVHNCRAYNAYNLHFHGANHIPLQGKEHSWLTDRDLANIRIPSGTNFILPYFRNSSTNYQIQSQSFNAAGGVISSTNSALQTDTEKLVLFCFNSTTLAVLGFAGVESYKVKISDTVTLTKEAHVKFDCQPKYTPVSIHFMNRYGAFETQVFSLLNRAEVEFEREYSSPSEWSLLSIPAIIPPPDPSVYVGSAVNKIGSVYNPTQVANAIKQSLSFTLSTDWLTEKDYNWLFQLIASPVVYLESAGYVYPVHITNKKWTAMNQNHDKFFCLDLQVKAFDNIYSQFQ